METEKVKQLIEAGLEGCTAEVTGDGRHFEAIVTYAGFAGNTIIKQHRMVMDTVKAELESEELHAFSIKTKTE